MSSSWSARGSTEALAKVARRAKSGSSLVIGVMLKVGVGLLSSQCLITRVEWGKATRDPWMMHVLCNVGDMQL